MAIDKQYSPPIPGGHMTDYDELVCLECERHLGWILYQGPVGLPMCDVCREKDEREERDGRHQCMVQQD